MQKTLKIYNEMLRKQAIEIESKAAAVCMDEKYYRLSFYAQGPFNIKKWRVLSSVSFYKQKKILSAFHYANKNFYECKSR